MFDQQPDDMFAGTEPAKQQTLNPNQRPANQVVPGRVVSPPIQGITPASAVPSPISSQILGDEDPGIGGGSNKKIFLAIIAVAVVLILGIGGYFAWRQLSTPSTQVLESGPSISNVPAITVPEESVAPPETEEPIDTSAVEAIMEEEAGVVDVDTDMDGIIDDEELNLGTNPMKVDSDDDGLTDREEVKIYKTDPLNPDTDGDTYLDGEEARGGYNPNGSGKLFELPVNSVGSEVVE